MAVAVAEPHVIVVIVPLVVQLVDKAVVALLVAVVRDVRFQEILRPALAALRSTVHALRP